MESFIHQSFKAIAEHSIYACALWEPEEPQEDAAGIWAQFQQLMLPEV